MVCEVAPRVEAIWRIEGARIIGGVARLVRDVGLAEDLAHESLVAALEKWPGDGVPDNPGAWLMAVAKHRALDHLRQISLRGRKLEELGADADALQMHVQPDVAGASDSPLEDIEDDLLRLIFVACHPVLQQDAQVALTLKLLGGLSTPEIARAFLVAEATMAQRIVRAKRALSEARIPFQIPLAEELPARLASVHEVIYLIFNEGYAAASGNVWTKPTLCDEAMRLARVLVELVPDDSETHGLQALVELQASRLRARVDEAGSPVLLMDQDRTRWDFLLITRGLAALDKAGSLEPHLGRYGLQASIAACHARAAKPEETDWRLISAYYAELARHAPSPVIELNRLVARGMAEGTESVIAEVEALGRDIRMQTYGLFHAVRADLLAKLGRRQDARAAFEVALELANNETDRILMRRRIEGLQ